MSDREPHTLVIDPSEPKEGHTNEQRVRMSRFVLAGRSLSGPRNITCQVTNTNRRYHDEQREAT
jgi:hypothetical protein